MKSGHRRRRGEAQTTDTRRRAKGEGRRTRKDSVIVIHTGMWNILRLERSLHLRTAQSESHMGCSLTYTGSGTGEAGTPCLRHIMMVGTTTTMVRTKETMVGPYITCARGA